MVWSGVRGLMWLGLGRAEQRMHQAGPDCWRRWFEPYHQPQALGNEEPPKAFQLEIHKSKSPLELLSG